jgi:polyhydroxyalkanoate synthesis regulator protein
LTQIIFEQECKAGQSLLPITFLRQLIRFYGDSMQMLVPSYLEFTMGKLASEQARFREALAKNFGGPLTTPLFNSIEEQARKNMALFEQALQMFNPFAKPPSRPAEKAPGKIPEESSAPAAGQFAKSDLEEMKRQLDQLQKRIEGLAQREQT